MNSKMKALIVVNDNENPLVLESVDVPETEVGYALIKLSAVALNRRDFWISKGKYPNIQFDRVLGSDGCGEVIMVGKESDRNWIGKEVIINPNNDWGDSSLSQSKEYHILGMPTNGTFAEYISVKMDRIHEKPAHLNFQQAAALPLAGLTAYRAVFTQSEIDENSTVLISGFGGGVAQFAFQFSLAIGAKVFVTSGKDEKINLAKQMGALGGVNYKNEGWEKELKNMSGGFTHVIDSAGGDQVNKFIKMILPGGRYVFYGASLGLPKEIDFYRVFYNQIRIQGSTMGSDDEFKAMLNFVEQNKIEPIIDSIIPFEKILEAFDKMGKGEQTGKLVVSMENANQVGAKFQKSMNKVKSFFQGIWSKK